MNDEFVRFNHIEYSDPSLKFYDKVKYFFKLNHSSRNKSIYFGDCRKYAQNQEISLNDRKSMQLKLNIYNYFDFVSLGLLFVSIRYHKKQGYLSTNSRLLELYIFIKYMFYVYAYFSTKLFILKYFSDKQLFDYYSNKEYNNALYSAELRKKADYYRERARVKLENQEDK